VVPLPTWPNPLAPQQNDRLVVVSAQAELPAVTRRTVRPPETGLGVKRLRVLPSPISPSWPKPQHQARWSVVTAQTLEKPGAVVGAGSSAAHRRWLRPVRLLGTVAELPELVCSPAERRPRDGHPAGEEPARGDLVTGYRRRGDPGPARGWDGPR